MPLDKKPAEPFTSRQIAKLMAGLWTSFIPEHGLISVTDAFDHFVNYQNHYRELFIKMASEETKKELNKFKETIKDGE